MRLVALSTALALSFALSSGPPAAAAPAKKPAAAKTQAAASAGPTKQAAATKSQVRKKMRVATAAPAAQEVVNLNPESPEIRVAAQTVRAETTGSARPQPPRMPRLFASSDPVEEARRWIGTNPTDMSRRWCARFMNFVLERSGYSGTGSDAAKSFASYGRRVPGPRIGAIAVMHRKNGGHVGIVSGFDEKGNPIIISGNSVGRKVAEIPYPRSRIYAYVMPE
ncbi:MAG TPA: TIGR02594 family protein [Xanthobacteraceae bacterium]|nr:TIGR02594 family protein [Xanthobacteraceae bacterium]